MPTRRISALVLVACFLALFAHLLFHFAITPVAAQEPVSPADVSPLFWQAPLDFDRHACAIDKSRHVRCWGRNNEGQLGIGVTSTTLVTQPVYVIDPFTEGELLSDVVALDVMLDETCAVTRIGHVYCWGGNRLGATPLHFATVQEARAVLGNQAGTIMCVITLGSQIVCTDQNQEMPPGTPPELRWATHNYGAVENIIDFDVDWHLEMGEGATGCVLDAAGNVSCFGCDRGGSLGRGSGLNGNCTFNDFDIHHGEGVATVAGISNIQDISVADYGACALDDINQVWCWGNALPRNLEGYTSDETPSHPVRALLDYAKLGMITEIVLSYDGICIVNTAKEVWCVRLNTSNWQATTFKVDFPPVEHIVGRHNRLCGIDAAGTATCVGFASFWPPVVPGGAWVLSGGSIAGEITSELNPGNPPGLTHLMTISRTTSSGEVTSTTVNPDGEFNFAIAEGTFIFRPLSTGHEFTPFERTLTIVPADLERTVEVTFTAGPMPDSLLRPNVNGFAFRNWGSPPPTNTVDLNRVDIWNLFGAQACAAGTTIVDCVFKESVKQWRDEWLEDMAEGHCAGMTLGSTFIWSGKVNPAILQAGATNINQLIQGEIVTAYIARNHVLQSLQPLAGDDGWVVQYEDGRSPNEVLELIRTNLRNDKSNPLYLGFFQEGKGGHAVTPYRIEKVSNTVQRVYVYDNNHPGNLNRYLLFDTAANTWRYELGATSPEVAPSPWSGDAATQSLRLRNTAVVSAVANGGWWCETCVEEGALGAGVQGGTGLLVNPVGQSLLLLTNGNGQKVGWDGASNRYINQVSGAELRRVDNGTGVEVGAAIVTPAGGYSFALKNIDGAPVAGGLTAYGGGSVTGVTGTTVAPGATQTGMLGADGKSIRFTAATGATNPTLFLIDETGAMSVRIDVTVSSIAPGSQVEIKLNPDGTLNISDTDPASNTYTLEVERITAAGATENFLNATLHIPGTTPAIADVGAWDGSRAISVTIGGSQQLLPNALFTSYLPNVTQ